MAQESQGPTPAPEIAVIGAGYWGINHVRNFHELGCLRMVCDTSASALQRVRERFAGIETQTDLNLALRNPAIRAVVIATPAETHYRLAKEAILAGKDILVEKPLTLDVGEGERLVQMAHAAGTILMVGHLLEYHPAVLRLRELISSGELGELRYVYSNRLNLGKVRREENILWSFAPHDIAIILRLVGQMPINVSATGGAYVQSKIADVTVTNLEFANGVRGHIFVSWLHPYKDQRLVVIGSKRMAVFDDVKPTDKLVIYDQGVDVVNGEPVTRKSDPIPERLETTEPLRGQSQAFLNAIQNRQHPITDGESGLRVLRVLAAAEESLAAGGLPKEIKNRTQSGRLAR